MATFGRNACADAGGGLPRGGSPCIRCTFPGTVQARPAERAGSAGLGCPAAGVCRPRQGGAGR
eukprot:6860115-Lingulodinium_polyedra.AAC.1